MKKIPLYLLIGGILLSAGSCVKRTIPIPHPVPTLDSNTTRLTGTTWVYYEYFTRFDSTVTSLAWKTGRSTNALNLALNQVKFNSDSTYSEIDQNGNTLNGTWSFLNNETQVKVVNSQGTYISTIQALTGQRYEWWEGATNHYGFMVPKNASVDSAGGRLHLLTLHPWIYDEYFYDYNATAPALVWKSNKTNSTFNLSRNLVTYNADGTYSEIDQNGTLYNGTWTFLNNQTQVQVNNILGTFTSTIQRLDSARFEWSESTTNHYGEMIPR